MSLATRTVRCLVAAGLSLALVAGATPARASNDSLWGRQWGPAAIGAPTAWAVSTGAGVRIGIVDTGVDLAHPDLQDKVVAHTACIGTNGSASACRGSGQDAIGHGTHVAGIAAANKDNGVGIAGVAPDAKLVIARVFQGETAELDDVNAGIKWVVDQGARVVNLSLGEGGLLSGLLGSSGSLAEGVEYAWSRGAVPVLAAGNSNFFGLGSANYGNVNAVVVGATGRDNEMAAYSSPTGNAKWAVAAPGGNSARGGDAAKILSTYFPDDYGLLEGTSMAAPHVSAALALLLALPGVGQAQAVNLLLATAQRIACGSNCAGLLSVAGAVAATGATAAPAPVVTAPPVTAPPTTRAPRAPRTTTTAAPTPETAAPATEPSPPPVEETVPPTTEAPAVPLPPGEATVRPASSAEDAGPIGPAGGAAAVLLLAVAGWTGSIVVRRRRA